MAVVLGGACLAVLGATGGAAVATSSATTAARTLSAEGNYAGSIAVDDQIATRTGLLFMLDRSDVGGAAHQAQATLLAWAAQLARAGRIDQAAALLGSVTDPGLRTAATAEGASLLLQAARSAAGRGDYAGALLRLGQASALGPSGATESQVDQLTVQYEVGEAKALATAGNGVDAVALLDTAAAQAQPGQVAAVTAALPPALLAAARQEIALTSYKEAAATLQRLQDTFPNSTPARTAGQLLRAAQPVTGTLVDREAHPISGQVRLSSHYYSTPGGYYTTGPFYYSSANANGAFQFSAVPLGGPYVLEVNRGGDWMTFVDPTTGQPANPVSVAPLVPLDLTFIELP